MALEKLTIAGLETYYEYVPGMKNTDIQLVVKVGSLDEPDPLAGICHALEHCTHLKTASFDGQPMIDAFANRHAFYRNAATYYTRTKYYAKGLEPESMFKLVGELTTSAVFEPARVAEEMRSIRREALTSLDDIDDLDFNFRDYVLFGMPYGREVLGYHDRLDFSVDDLKNFYDTYYTLSNMALVVVGDIPLDDVRRLVEKYITATAQSHTLDRPARPVPAMPYPDITAYGYVREDTPNARLCLQTVTPPTYIERDDKDEWAYAAARSLISKAIIDEVRYARGLSYDGFFSMASYNHRTASRFKVEVTVDVKDIDETFGVIREVMARGADSYTDEQLTEAIGKQRMDAAESVDDVMGRANMYVDMLTYGTPMDSVEDSFEKSKELLVADVRRALRDTLGIWCNGKIIECVTGPKTAVGDRFVIDQSLFA